MVFYLRKLLVKTTLNIMLLFLWMGVHGEHFVVSIDPVFVLDSQNYRLTLFYKNDIL